MLTPPQLFSATTWRLRMENNGSDWRSTKLPQPAPPNEPEFHAPLHTHATKKRRKWPWIVGILLLVCLVAAAAAFMWYQQALQPRDRTSKREWRIQIAQGETVSTISEKLQQEGIISNAFAFQLYTQLMQSKNNLQAGTYILSPSQSVPTVVDHLVKGKVDTMMVTIVPGTTIRTIQKDLQEDYGFSPDEVEDAFTLSYNHPLLQGRPKGASLEGYLFPETYQLNGNEKVSSLFERSFDQMYTKIKEQKLEAAFKKKNLSLHKAITLASIIQKEVVSEKDMKQVAQIFYKRLAIHMPLGADATFIYGADLLGVEPRVSLDSPYNTRVIKGLPPGPIGTVSLAALEAVAHPAKGNYLYFVSGDDGTTYYSETLKEHEAKTQQYCKKNCAIFNN